MTLDTLVGIPAAGRVSAHSPSKHSGVSRCNSALFQCLPVLLKSCSVWPAHKLIADSTSSSVRVAHRLIADSLPVQCLDQNQGQTPSTMGRTTFVCLQTRRLDHVGIITLNKNLPISPSPHLPISPSPHLPISPSPHLHISPLYL